MSINEIIVMCPAKINLFLNIVGVKDDKHLLKMINQSVDLYDFLTIKLNETGEINITSNNKYIPTDYNNTVFKAAYIMKQLYDIHFGFDINITKNIPTGAGLGGESTDAAGTILGIKELLDIYINDSSLISIGAAVGSNVPFCLVGGTCLVDGTGEIIRKIVMKQKQFLIIKPNFSTNTAEMFEAFDKYCGNYSDFDGYIIGQNDFEIIAPPEIQDIKNYLASFGAYYTNMTGSGSSVIGTFNNKKYLLSAYKNLKKYFQNYTAYIVKPCDGVEVLKKTRFN